jgi:hypothetical protein
MHEENTRFKNNLHVPRMKPYSNDTWEVQGSLDGSDEQSAVVPLVFPAKCRIVGILPTLTLNQTGSLAGLLIPTTDDIMVSLNFNQQRLYTNQIGQTAQALRGQSFVTLTSLDTRIRDLNIVVDTPRPQMSAQFRWKRFISGTPLYPDQIIALALMVEIDD